MLVERLGRLLMNRLDGGDDYGISAMKVDVYTT